MPQNARYCCFLIIINASRNISFPWGHVVEFNFHAIGIAQKYLPQANAGERIPFMGNTLPFEQRHHRFMVRGVEGDVIHGPGS